MDAIRRLKPKNPMLYEAPSPTATASASPTTSRGNYSDSGDGDNEAGPSGTNGSEPWYRVPRRDHPKSRHGYELFRFSLQKEGEPRLSECVAFWPFVSPEDLNRAAGRFDDMQGVFAVACHGRVMVGKVSDKGYEDLWSYETEDEEHYHVAWSYDPITLRPILASGGASRSIWLFDHWLGGPTRIFRGHGDEILSIVFHPIHPHIFASASGDNTIRIWNIFGTDVERAEGDREPLSENYPQGDADEGSCLLAILAGGKAGHKAGVSALAFHPNHNALASGGCDHEVKIWRLPPIPPPDPTMPPTSRGYRPETISMPLFSTDRLHRSPVDSIEWLNSDMLLTRADAETSGWKWLGYKNHFTPGQLEPHNIIARATDMVSSHSFSITLDVVEDPADWFWRLGLHLAFNPTEDEIDSANVDLVVDTIFVYPVMGFPPRLHLINPLTWEPGPDPSVFREYYRRSLTPDLDGQVWVPSQLGASETMAIKIEDDVAREEDGGMHQATDFLSKKGRDDEAGEDEDCVIDSDRGMGVSAASKKRKVEDRSSVDPDESDSDSDILILPTPTSMPAPTPSDPPPKNANDSGDVDPWSLVVKKQDIDKAVAMTKLSLAQKKELKKSKKLLRCVAVSPRGAKWVVAVGQAESMAIWRLRDNPSKI